MQPAGIHRITLCHWILWSPCVKDATDGWTDFYTIGCSGRFRDAGSVVWEFARLNTHTQSCRNSLFWKRAVWHVLPSVLLHIAIFQATLAAALGERGTITKKRRVFTMEDARIYLDDVDQIGQFIDIAVSSVKLVTPGAVVVAVTWIEIRLMGFVLLAQSPEKPFVLQTNGRISGDS